MAGKRESSELEGDGVGISGTESQPGCVTNQQLKTSLTSSTDHRPLCYLHR